MLFQAEEGIPDTGVTGVQTCALPISSREQLTSTRSSHLGRRTARSRLVRLRGRWRCERGNDRDRKSVVLGKSVDLGGRRIIKKKYREEYMDLRAKPRSRANRDLEHIE